MPLKVRVTRKPIIIKVKPHVKGVGSHPLVGAPRHTILISARMPKKWRKPLIFHEKHEYRSMKKGMPYKKAHRLADKAEKAKYFPNKSAWKKYMAKVYQIHRGGK